MPFMGLLTLPLTNLAYNMRRLVQLQRLAMVDSR